jgi:hypothetical protein
VFVRGREIPSDAIEGGKDVDDDTFYIARAYVEVKSSFAVGLVTR